MPFKAINRGTVTGMATIYQTLHQHQKGIK